MKGLGRIKGNSIKVRLFIASLASIALALVIAGFGLVKLFEHHVEQRFAAELTNHIRQLASTSFHSTCSRVWWRRSSG